MTMGSRIVVMKDGVIQQVAPPLELYHQPANQFVAGFIGSPPMNFFTGKLEDRNGALFFNEGGFAVRLDNAQTAAMKPFAGKEVIFGIRPADIASAGVRPARKPPIR